MKARFKVLLAVMLLLSITVQCYSPALASGGVVIKETKKTNSTTTTSSSSSSSSASVSYSVESGSFDINSLNNSFTTASQWFSTDSMRAYFTVVLISEYITSEKAFDSYNALLNNDSWLAYDKNRGTLTVVACLDSKTTINLTYCVGMWGATYEIYSYNQSVSSTQIENVIKKSGIGTFKKNNHSSITTAFLSIMR